MWKRKIRIYDTPRISNNFPPLYKPSYPSTNNCKTKSNFWVGFYKILVTDPRVARDYFLWWSHYYYYYYFVIWTNLMKINAFHNHIYHKIIFYYCRIVLFEIWNLNSTIVGWLIFYISKSIKHVLHATYKPSFP